MTIPDHSDIQGEMTGASESLKEAQQLFNQNSLGGAVSRSYYAVFHASRAVLWSRGFSPKTHKGLIQMFGQKLVKPGVVDKELGSILSDLHDKRQLADYHVYSGDLSKDDVEKVVESAEHFIETLKIILEDQVK